MPRLNNKDYTVEQLERLIYLSSMLAVEAGNIIKPEVDPIVEEVKELVKGSQFTNFGEEKIPVPISWNFKFEMLINPQIIETAAIIRNAMRSAEVNENIKKRFNTIVREEVNWYIDRVKYFTVKGDTNVLE